MISQMQHNGITGTASLKREMLFKLLVFRLNEQCLDFSAPRRKQAEFVYSLPRMNNHVHRSLWGGTARRMVPLVMSSEQKAQPEIRSQGVGGGC